MEDVEQHVLGQMAADERESDPLFDDLPVGGRDVRGPRGESAHERLEVDTSLDRKLRQRVMVAVEERLDLWKRDAERVRQSLLVER